MSLVGVVVPGVTHPGGQTSTRITAASPSGVAETSGCLRTSPTLGAAHTGFGGTAHLLMHRTYRTVMIEDVSVVGGLHRAHPVPPPLQLHVRVRRSAQG